MNRRLNILFLGGAKRVSMARLFKKAAAALGCDAAIFSYELETCVPIACEATVIKGCRWTDPDALAKLDADVDRYDIDIIVPFVDGAVALAAQYAAAYPGKVFVPTGSADKAELMFDKILAARAFEDAVLPVPLTYIPGAPSMRLIAKPRHGSASKGIIEISSVEALDDILLRRDEYLIQERIDNRRELTVDCYRSVVTGETLAVSPRLRLATVGGEVSDTVTVDNPAAVQLATDVLERIDLRGAVTVQLIEDLDCPSRLLVMEVNPRLGGGAVCSVLAGADIPALIISEALDLPAKPLAASPDLRIVRYPREIPFKDNKLLNY